MNLLRNLSPGDLEKLIQIESICQISPWSMEVFEKCFEKGAFGFALECDDQIVGFIMAMSLLTDAHILNLCILPQYQSKGLGQQLLRHLLADLREKGATSVYLEVRRSNQHAIRLYEKIGFQKIGERKNYYISPELTEDALVFVTQLSSES